MDQTVHVTALTTAVTAQTASAVTAQTASVGIANNRTYNLSD